MTDSAVPAEGVTTPPTANRSPETDETPAPGFRFKGDELQERIRAVLPDECWVTRSTLACTDFVGGTFGDGATWTAEMCCLPCRIRSEVDALYPPAGGEG